jgi:hypothetical protein
MSVDIYMDVTYHLKSQAGEFRGLEPDAEIEARSGGNSATHHQVGSVGIP